MPDSPDPTLDSDAATLPLSGPRPTLSGNTIDLPLPEELTALLPHGMYQVQGFLGAGGMGAVYKGTQVRLKRPVAIKIMRRDMGRDQDFEARFEREAQAMAKLNHPNIVSVIDYGEAGPDYLYIVMELIDGADMMDVIRGGQMTQEMALSLLPQICDALQFAHDHGIVHRDIKPSNIMLTRDGRIKMADFGLAKHFDAESSFRTQTGTGMGTPDYAAPEQFSPNSPIDHRADIYALGVMIYQMITGQLPRGVWKPPSQRAEVAPQWDAIVSRAMQSDPIDRYQQASEVKTAVSTIPLSGKEGSAGTLARPAASGVTAAKNDEADKSGHAPVKSRAPLLFGLIGGAVVIAIGAFFALKKPTETSPPTASTRVVTSSPPVAESWVRVWDSPEQLSSAVTLVDGWVVSKTGGTTLGGTLLYPRQWHDSAIRSEWKWSGGPSSGSIGGHISIRESGKHRYKLSRNKKAVLLHRTDDDNATVLLQEHPVGEPKEGETFTLELRAVGTTLTAKLDGKEIIRVEDDKLTTGGPAVYVFEKGGMRNIEVLNLDQPVVVSAPSPPASKPSTVDEVWMDMLHGSAKLALTGGVALTSEGLRFNDYGTARFPFNQGPQRDGAVRLRATFGGARPLLIARASTNGGHYQLSARQKEKSVVLDRWDIATQKVTELRVFPLRVALQPGQDYELELRAVGQTLSARLNGETLGSVIDGALPEGSFGVQNIGQNDGMLLVKSLEVLDLTASAKVSPAPNLPVSASHTAAEPWQDAMRDPVFSAKAPKTAEGILVAAGGGRFENGPQRDGAVRIRAAYSEELASNLRVLARKGPEPNDPYYQAHVTAKGIFVELRDGAQNYTSIGKAGNSLLAKPLEIGESFEFEFRVVGKTLTLKLNGKVLNEFEDPTLAAGHFAVTSGKPQLVQSIEYLNLDKPAAVSPSPNLPVSSSSAAATKDSPFTNSLGMKFVPVPGTKVLFSIWDTRVQDYVAFAKAQEAAGKKVNGLWKTQQKEGVPCGREPDHPVVGVSWEDAQAFCQWLTEKESAEGKLPPGQRYRLPTDEEWSIAVGLPPEQGKTPQEKHGKNDADYPWGREWPPKTKVGNYADESFHTKFPKPDATDPSRLSNAWLGGYTDGYATTSPVGAFPANAQGLYDMGGNVWQWCEDWSDTSQRERVLRGGSFVVSTPIRVLSSSRFPRPPTDTYIHYGFRCVLAASGGPAPTPSTSSASGSAASDIKSFAGHRYQYFHGTWNRDQAKAFAKSLGGYLVTITSAEEQEWLEQNLAPLIPMGHLCRTGLQLTGLSWTWATGERITFTAWPPGQPKQDPDIQTELDNRKDPTGNARVRGTLILRRTAEGLVWEAEHEGAQRSIIVEWDDLSKSAATPATATKDAPFVNTLGMKFVPVPITGGPTDKQHVLFSVWETRVQDYEAFVKETKRVWTKAPFEQGPTHPAVMVSWEEASAFCVWLTERDRKAGKVSLKEAYRLPTDHEWSCAVGIGDREDPRALPNDKDKKIADAFPWGSTWPPREKTGNYAGEEMQAYMSGGKYGDIKSVLSGYNDGFVTTSPVGTFAMNTYGLCDLSGNLWEWCDDWHDATQKGRVVRGSSWHDQDRHVFLSANRGRFLPDAHYFSGGFRCVLAPAP